MSEPVEVEFKERPTRAARMPLAVLVAALVCVGLCACGGGGDGSHSASGASSGASAGRQTLPAIEVTEDADQDSDKYGSEPDNEHELFGHLADATDARLVTALVEHYYAAAAHENGAAGCGLLYSPFAESLVEAYGGAGGSPSLHGDTCAEVLSKLFTQLHHRLSDGTTVRVAAVRVEFNLGSVRFGFAGMKPTRYMLAHRERGAWKLDLLLDVGHPVGVE